MVDFRKRVKTLRQEKQLTKEEFCKDETELSVRQLTRIESGISTPTLAKIEFIAHRLGVKIGALTDETPELPARYEEIKFLLLRTQTYGNEQKIKERDALFAEISSSFYDTLPEEEQLIIDCLQAKSDVNFSRQTDFGAGILADYFEQTKQKVIFSINDLVLLNLYFMCCIVSELDEKFYDKDTCQLITQKLLHSKDYFPPDKWFLLIKLFLEAIEVNTLSGVSQPIDDLLVASHDIMTQTQDFQYLPMVYILEWKYSIRLLKDCDRAKQCYNKAILFSQMIGDNYLTEKLIEEWKKDYSGRTEDAANYHTEAM